MLDQIRILHDDHVYIRSLLRALAVENGAFCEGRQVYPLRLRKIARNLVDFLEERHHPREEMLLDELAMNKQTTEKVVDLLIDEHRHCERHVRQLAEAADCFGRLRSGQPSGWVLLADVIDRVTLSMQFEEQSLYPMIERAMAKDDFDEKHRSVQTRNRNTLLL